MNSNEICDVVMGAFQSLWKVKKYDNTIELVTPVATVNDMFVSVFITMRGNEYVVTDGGWLESGIYDCEVCHNNLAFQRSFNYYSESFKVSCTEARNTKFYYKKIEDLVFLPNLVFDIANFVCAVVNYSSVLYQPDRSEVTFRKNVRGFMRKQYGDDAFEYDKPINKDINIHFNAIKRREDGISLINFVTGSNAGYYAMSLCKSNSNFDIANKYRNELRINKTITILDDRRTNVINSSHVKPYYEYLLDLRSDTSRVALWSDKNEIMEELNRA